MLSKGCILAVVICCYLCSHTRLPRAVASCLSATSVAVTIFHFALSVYQSNLTKPRMGRDFVPMRFSFSRIA
jgi:hypothetical protein